jgi:hypothetical protein
MTVIASHYVSHRYRYREVAVSRITINAMSLIIRCTQCRLQQRGGWRSVWGYRVPR